MSWDNGGLVVDSESRFTESDEEFVDTLMDQIFEGQFATVSEIKQTAAKP